MKILKVLLVSIFSLLISTQALADTIYVIKKGDSLYKLSRKFKIEIKNIKDINNLYSNILVPGTKIILPAGEPRIQAKLSTPGSTAYKSPAEIKKEEDNSESAAAQQPAEKKSPETYTVRKGDNLWEIAKKYSVSVKELKKLNNLKSNKLKPAQKLFVEKWVPGADIKTPVITSPEPNVAEEIKTLSDSPEFQSTTLRERLILFAQKMLGIPYKFGSSTFIGIDCSAFVQKAFNFVGIPLPRTAREQFNFGESVDKEDLSIGDLVFFRTYAPFPSHVGIYLGNNLFIHASRMTRKVTIDSLDTPYYLKRFIGAKRIELEEIE